jgi:hypothetical protein
VGGYWVHNLQFAPLSEAKNLYPKDHARGTRFFTSFRMTSS